MMQLAFLRADGETLRERIASRLWWVIVFLLFVLSNVFGSLTSLGILVLALVLAFTIEKEALLAALREPFTKLFVAGFAIMMVSFVVTAREPFDAINAFNFIPMILALPVFVMARKHAGERLLRTISVLCLVGVFVAAVIGATEVLALGQRRAGAFLNNEIVYGRTALIIGFLALIGFLLGGRHRLWFLLGPVLGVCVLVFSGTRGGMVALPAMTIIAALAVLTATGRSMRTMLIALCGIGLIAVLVFVLQAMTNERLMTLIEAVSAVLTGEGHMDRSTAYRLEMYTAGIAAFMDRPWLGYGWAHLTSTASSYMDADLAERILGHQNHLHNDFLNFAVAAGVPGIVAVLGFLIAPLVQLRMMVARTPYVLVLSYAVLVIVVTYIIAGLFDMTLGYDISTTFYALALAVFFGAASPVGTARAS